MKLRYTPRARFDINQIYEYIARQNTNAASAVVRQIRLASELLAQHPGLGRETDIEGVRVLPIARYPYLVYHRIRGDTVVVVHVRDGRRDAPQASEF